VLNILQSVYSIIIGIVQGVSEWLPISSKTQVLLTSQALLHLNFQQAYTFGLFMEVGTILAAVIYFRRDIFSLAKVIVLRGTHGEKKLFVYVLTATIITGLIGTPIYLIADSIKGVSIGIPMLVIGLVLIGDAVFIRYSKKKRAAKGTNMRKFESLGMKDYIIIGAAQGIAALPGVSRSGITTSVMFLLNVEADEVFRLSFIIGIFASGGAFGLTFLASHANVSVALSQIGLTGLLIAIATATVVSLFLIDFLIRIASKSKIVYLITALGIIALASGVLYIVYSSLGIPVVS
jgi:undecaprenyl-diphosphatase